MTRCGHPLCELLGDECGLASGLSRGCQTGPRGGGRFEPALIEEVSALLEQLAPPLAEPARTAATRLAFLFRREARSGRSLLTLVADDELEPALGARLAALCRKRAS